MNMLSLFIPHISHVQGYNGFEFFLNACSPNYINSAWVLNSRPLQRASRSRTNSETEAMDATPHCSVVFHPPELPEDTLMEVKRNTVTVR